MQVHLETDGPIPSEYLELVLCRDVYHCPPDVLDRQDASRVLTHILCASMEAEHKKGMQDGGQGIFDTGETDAGR